MRDNCLSYSEVVNYFGSTKITNRYKYIYDKMAAYIRARELEDELFIHEGVLQQAVMDYFVDMFRMKEFHKIDRADMTKIMAYEAYWILRRKPLQACAGALDSRLVFANEGFITTWIAHELLIGTGEEPMSQDEEDNLLEFLRHLNYHLKYRSYDKQNLELMLYAYGTGRSIEKD